MTAVRLIHGDARELPLDDESVDLIVTSPPYFALRDYKDGDQSLAGQIGSEATPQEFLKSLWVCTQEWRRVLKASGSLWVNLGDKYSGAQAQNTKARSGNDSSSMWRQTNPRNTGIPAKSLMGLPWRYAIGCIDDLGLILRAEVIWSKPNGLPESVTDRVRRSHEHWFHFTKSPRYFSAVDEIREDYCPDTVNRYRYGFQPGIASVAGQSNNGTLRNDHGGPHVTNPLGKLPGSVWTIPTEPLHVPDELGVDHFAAFPTEWPRRLILGWSPADGVVLDPFCGTGTTVAVAKALGREGIGVDLSTDYLRLADWRCNGDGYRRVQSKVLGTKPDKVSQYDVPLFDVEAL